MGGIFVIKGTLGAESTLLEMTETPYDSESVLQELIERYPSLLAGNLVNPESPRRWLVVRREQPVSDGESEYRWSLDHLLIDQDGIPTLVEVKRASDTRIRREVVGQMLDYAANAVVHWPADTLRATFEATHQDWQAILEERFGKDIDPDWLWGQVRERLETGRIRLAFVADRIPKELRRIVEFMNDQMRCEVLAVEIKQHRTDDDEAVRTLTASVYGRTERSAERKAPQIGKIWTRDGLLADAHAKLGLSGLKLVERLLDWGAVLGLTERFGKGTDNASVTLEVPSSVAKPVGLVWISTGGSVQIGFSNLAKTPSYESADARRAVGALLTAKSGVLVSEKNLGGWPGTTIGKLQQTPAFLDGLLGELNQIVAELGQASGIDLSSGKGVWSVDGISVG